MGAGKTTTLSRLARHYMDQDLRVGIVTNDQASDLVDTNTLRSQGFDVGEVAGACFCCNFNELMDTIEKLGESRKPDVLLAEPVGSCTDLVATVIQPIKRLFDAEFQIAPYPVILKPSDLALSVGVIKVADSTELAAAYEFTSAVRHGALPDWRPQLLLEEYADGEEISIDAAVHRGEVTLLCVARKEIGHPPYCIEVGHYVHGGDPLRIAYAEIRTIRFTGKDPAAGNSYAAWLRRRAEEREKAAPDHARDDRPSAASSRD